MYDTIYRQSFDKNDGAEPVRLNVYVDGDKGIVAEVCNVRFSEYLKGAGQVIDFDLRVRLKGDEPDSEQ